MTMIATQVLHVHEAIAAKVIADNNKSSTMKHCTTKLVNTTTTASVKKPNVYSTSVEHKLAILRGDQTPKQPRHVPSPCPANMNSPPKKKVENCVFVGSNRNVNSSNSNPNTKFGLLDQLLLQHDQDDSDSSDDDASCCSAGSYGSLSFGDDTLLLDDDSDSDSSYDSSDLDSEDDSDDDSSYNLENDDEDDDDMSDSSFSSMSSMGSGDISISSHDFDMSIGSQDVEIPILPAQPSKPIDTGMVRPQRKASMGFAPSYTPNAPPTRAVTPPPPTFTTTRKSNKPKLSIRFDMQDTVHYIPHHSTLTHEEMKATYMSRQEAKVIRRDMHRVVQAIESGSVPKNVTTRGLEKHTAKYNLKLKQLLDMMYAAVFKIQALNLPPGMMDVPATIADVCTNITKPMVDAAAQVGQADAKEVLAQVDTTLPQLAKQ